MEASGEVMKSSLIDSDFPDNRSLPRVRKRTPSVESDRKRYRPDGDSPEGIPRSRSEYERPGWDRDAYGGSRRANAQHIPRRNSSYTPHSSSYDAPRSNGGGAYENGFSGHGGPNGQAMYQPRAAPKSPHSAAQANRSRRLYVGNIPYHAGLTDVALTQFFSALYVAGFRPNRPGEPLPVVSFWLQADGKFGFIELRGAQETVNMMQFNGVFLHGRPLRVNRPSDYRPEQQDPADMNLVPDVVNIQAIIELCDKLGGVAAAPAQLAAIAASQEYKEGLNVPQNAPPPAPVSLPISAPAPSPMQAPHLRSQPSTGTSSVAKPSNDNITRPPRDEEPRSPVDSPLVREHAVISLQNLVTNDDLEGSDEDYQELLEDVQQECQKYGSVASLNIPRKGPWKGTAFVQFTDSTSATRAIEALRTRVFDERQISATLVKECETATEAAMRQPTA